MAPDKDHFEVRDALLNKIQELAESTTQSKPLLRLAETYAWCVAPAQSHGRADSEQGN